MLFEILNFLNIVGVPSLFVIMVILFKYVIKMGAGIQALLRSNLYHLYDDWEGKGYAPRDVKANFENLYNWYHALGNNGVMTKKYEEFLELPDKLESED